MNKTTTIKESINHATSQITDLHKLGDQWKYNYYDESVNAWRESTPQNYFAARLSRSVHLVFAANKFLYKDIDVANCAAHNFASAGFGHRWQDFVN